MKYLFFLAAVFAVCFYAGKHFAAIRVNSARLAVLEQGAFRPSPYPLQNRSFVLVLTGRNHGASVEKTLRSVVSQRYDSYRVIYIDDASDDGSFDIVQDFVREHGDSGQFVLAKNEKPLGVLGNIFRAVQECQDSEIVVLLDDTGWLSHEWVLSRLNQYYAHPDLWLTYGQYRQYPGYELGKTKLVDGHIRDTEHEAFHLTTFYASLFKQIHPSDLVHQGTYFDNALAYMLPMLEMSEGHASFVPDVLYVSSATRTAQAGEIIRAKTAYRPLEKTP